MSENNDLVIVKCGECDSENAANAQYCQNCGKELKHTTTETKEIKEKRSVKWLIVIPAAIILGLMMLVAGFTALIIFIPILIIIGYLVKNPRRGAINGLIIGGFAFFLLAFNFPIYYLASNALLFIFLGIFIGGILGYIGGYIYKFNKKREEA